MRIFIYAMLEHCHQPPPPFPLLNTGRNLNVHKMLPPSKRLMYVQFTSYIHWLFYLIFINSEHISPLT